MLFEQNYAYQPLVNKSATGEKRMTGFFKIVRQSINSSSDASSFAQTQVPGLSSIIPKAQAPQAMINA